MTQEELDALMGEEMIDGDDSIEDTDITSDIDDTEGLADELGVENGVPEAKSEEDDKPYGYTEENKHHWPLPATEEHKMVHQLDDVTKESEEKATEIFDIIENISNELMEEETSANSVIEVLTGNIELFTTLSKKFSDVEAFKEQLEKNETALADANKILSMINTSGDEIMNVMDIMQYQDIHRQKIERVINVMRALSRYMNTLFEGKIDDDKRVASAQHIPGDDNADIASTDDIEALLAQFGN